jgi:peptide deformylase
MIDKYKYADLAKKPPKKKKKKKRTVMINPKTPEQMKDELNKGFGNF